MKIQSRTLGILIFMIIFGGILVTSGLNMFQTESSKIPVRYSDGIAAGEYNPVDIRGSYSFGEISTLFDIPLADLAAAFGVQGDLDQSAFMCKDLEGLYEAEAEAGTEIGTASVRLFVALYKGLPYTLDETTYLLQPALPILRTQGHLNDEQLAFVESHVIKPDNISHEPANTAGQEPANENDHDENAAIVKGKTTFRDLLDWGLTQDEIEGVLGIPMPNPLMLIRDHCAENGLEFGIIKSEFQVLVDKKTSN